MMQSTSVSVSMIRHTLMRRIESCLKSMEGVSNSKQKASVKSMMIAAYEEERICHMAILNLIKDMPDQQQLPWVLQ
jgi:hypothetical protein